MHKIKHLEGLRGLAALIVVNEHLLKFFFVMAFSDSALRQSGMYESLSFPPLNLLHNGAWAVCAFFVLSGYVLSQSFFQKGLSGAGDPIAKTVARYFRLAIPVTGSLVLVWILMSLNGIYFADAAALTQTKEIDQYGSAPTIINLLQQGFGSALLKDNYSYNPPLWTMSVEMIASIGVFVLHLVFYSFSDSKNAFGIRLAIYVGLLILLSPTLYAGFILGMLICDCKNNAGANLLLEKYSKYWSPVAMTIGVALCGYMIRGLYNNPYSVVTFEEFNPYHEYLYNTWGAFFLIFGLSYSQKAKDMLSGKNMMVLGKLSFSLYLTHYLVMSSFTAYLYVSIPFDSHMYRALASIGISIPIMFIVAYVFEKIVNEPALRISKAIYSKVTRILSKGIGTSKNALQAETAR